MTRRLEATIWCPSCLIDLFRVWGVNSDDQPQHFRNETEALTAQTDTKTCGTCGAMLERKR